MTFVSSFGLRLGRLVMRQRLGWMMRRRNVHDVLHERTPITRLSVPEIIEKVTPLKTFPEVVLVEHGQSMTHAVHALKPNPSQRVARPERLAECIGVPPADAVEPREPRLNDTVITSRLERFGALRESSRHIVRALSRGDADGVSVHMTIGTDIRIEWRKLSECAHCKLYLSFGRERHESRLVARHARCRVAAGIAKLASYGC